ncbi:MAG: N-acetyltransferase family protein [Haloarculaceae archaeon]
MTVRPYDWARDAAALWELKRAFELELAATGSEDKQSTYAEKLTDDYRAAYLGWVDRCVERNERCVQVAVDDADDLVGYVFVLPESHAYIWDAAVLNEIYLREGDRGAGVADALIEAAFDVAREQDLPLDRVVLDVDGANERAGAFYERHGFEHWGEMVARDL